MGKKAVRITRDIYKRQLSGVMLHRVCLDVKVPCDEWLVFQRSFVHGVTKVR